MKNLKSFAAGILTAAAAFSANSATAQTAEYKQITNLPTVYIDTEDYVSITSKETYVRATLRYVDKDGTTVYDALGIRGRGNSTWGLDKKPYRIKFDKKQSFLGKDRAKAKSWTMLANHTDKTLMRNALASYIGTLAGQPFTAAAQFVDVVLNGKLIGNYQISDQMEIREKRIDILEQEDPATAESNITGGYLLEVDGFASSEPVYFRTSKGVTITIKSPDDDIINDAQIKYIQNHIQKFETALFSSDFKDPEKGYRRYVDAETLVSWYVASEITGNPDMFWSTYIYKKHDDDKIYWGPMWDYDIAFNNCYRKGDLSRKVMFRDGFAQDLTALWINRMWQDPWFVALVDAKWKELKAMDFESLMLDFVDETAALLEQSQKLNFDMWPIATRVYDEYRLFGTYKEGVDFLKDYLRTHNAYLESVISRQVTALDAIGADGSAAVLGYDREAGCITVAGAQEGTVEIYNMAGAVVMRSALKAEVGVSVLPAGVYVARCTTPRGIVTLKFVR